MPAATLVLTCGSIPPPHWRPNTAVYSHEVIMDCVCQIYKFLVQSVTFNMKCCVHEYS
jgi:hypothetical protein